MTARAPRSSIGRYHVIAELGRGGVAQVYLAWFEGAAGTKKLVVVKVLRPMFANDDETRKMFIDEARLAARVHHPNVVASYELGFEGDEAFLAMEYLEGQPLAAIRRAEWARPLPTGLHLRAVCDVLAGLHHAHELADYDGKPLALVHRDVNPSNVFVTYDGQAKLLDFGIAKAVSNEIKTQSGVVRGTIGYIAPEQILGLDADRRADVYAAGVLLWEAATRVRMWSGKLEIAVMQAVLDGALPRPRGVNPDVPEPLERICMRALARRPEERYATAAEMAAELEAFLATMSPRPDRREMGRLLSELFADERTRVRALVEEKLGPGVAPARAREEHTLPSTRASGPPPTGLRRSIAIALGAASVTAAIAVVVAAPGRDRAPPAAAPPTPSEPARVARVRFLAVPVEAHFALDGRPFEGNPTAAVLPKDDLPHTLTVEADGYAPRRVDVRLDRDLDLEFVLSPVADARAPR